MILKIFKNIFSFIINQVKYIKNNIDENNKYENFKKNHFREVRKKHRINNEII